MSVPSGCLAPARRPLVPLDYEFVAGKHFFTAATSFGQGLCVAHGDLGTAFDEAGRQLRAILFENHRVEVAGPEERLAGFEEFRSSLGAAAPSGQERSKRIAVDWAQWRLETQRP